MIIAGLGEDNVLTPIRLERRITRLAHHFNREGRLSVTGIGASMAALADYAALTRAYGVQGVACGATGVVRRAPDGPDFLMDVSRSFGFPASMLSEEEEARLSARGVLSVLPRKQWPILIFDLGGSTTEFLLVREGRPAASWSSSVFVGAATLTEAWIHGDPPDPGSVRRAVQAARETLRPAIETVHAQLGLETPESLQLVGTAGTVTTLAAMHLGMTRYEPHRVNGVVLKLNGLQETIDLLASASLAERREIPGLESGREDIILGGALIVAEILRGLGREELTVTDGGLLEGLLIDHVERSYGWPQRLQTALMWAWGSFRPNE
jgi:exopolyphosphatase/guanosine-5'-triphosphate,3'-diphosphate pyrophosphatase